MNSSVRFRHGWCVSIALEDHRERKLVASGVRKPRPSAWLAATFVLQAESAAVVASCHRHGESL